MLIAIGTILVIWAGWMAVYDRRNFFLPYLLAVGAVCMVLGFLIYPAASRDLGQWENSDPAIRQWYRSLMQPDNPTISCCGEADAYWCDSVFVSLGKTFCVITDDREDAPLGRRHVPVGTAIHIPDHKLKWDRGNPTGHAVVFLNSSNDALCFVQGSGI